MLENCCYGYNELLVLNMVRAGLLGELTHAEAAYIHDLREILFDDHEGLWRRDEHFARNGNLYPTHGLGPVARYLDINRGDRFEALVSMSSRETSLSARRDRLPAGDPRRNETYACGDMNTSILRTARGPHRRCCSTTWSRRGPTPASTTSRERRAPSATIRRASSWTARRSTAQWGSLKRPQGALRAPAVDAAGTKWRARAATAAWTTS